MPFSCFVISLFCVVVCEVGLGSWAWSGAPEADINHPPKPIANNIFPLWLMSGSPYMTTNCRARFCPLAESAGHPPRATQVWQRENVRGKNRSHTKGERRRGEEIQETHARLSPLKSAKRTGQYTCDLLSRLLLPPAI